MSSIRRVRPIVAPLALVLALASIAWAGPATDQVKAAVEQVLRIVQDAELRKPPSADKRRTRIREVARSIFDFEEMSRRALARHWAGRTPEQRKRFTELFTDLLEQSYVAKIEAYTGEKVLYLPEQVDGPVVTVRSRLVTQTGVEVPLDYRMQEAGGRWRAYDVIVEGVSLVANYRTQFNSIISRSSYDGLIKRLEERQVETPQDQKPRTP